MRFQLNPHSDKPSAPVRSIRVEIGRIAARALRVRYLIEANMREICMPSSARSLRTDELWHHSCFELFIRPGARPDYLEFNFSPSTAWAAYQFDDYRAGMTELCIPPPPITVDHDTGSFVLEVEIQLDPSISVDVPWHIGLSAVIEATDGTKSYWALAHPPGAPDFHHPDCFALELPAVG